MTDDQKQELRELKVLTGATLARTRVEAYRLGEVDGRLEAYVRAVIGNPGGHNLWEQLAVARFLRMCRRYGLNADEIWRFYTFYESLYFPGLGGMSRYRLTPVQAFQFASIYGFWNGGRRVTREGVLYVPRKFSKTTGSTSVAVYDLLFGDANAESYTGANSADQAKKCFDVIRGIMRRLDPHERRYTVNEQIIKSKRADRSAFAQCLTANARTKDGLNASTVIMDEFSQARDMNLLSVLTTSSGVRPNPLTMIITTASDVFDGPFYTMLQGYKNILRGDYEDDSVFAHLFEPDVDDAEDSPATWAKVQPHMGITVQPDFYRQEYAGAQRKGAEGMLAFRTKLLNVYRENERRAWISSTLARHMARPMSASDLPARYPAMVGIDLSESDDFSAVTVGVGGVDGRGTFRFVTDYFFPRGALPGHPNEKLYRVWAEAGHLHLLEGDVIDYRAIAGHILELSRRLNILAVGYDPYKSREMVNMLANASRPGLLRPVRQTLGEFTAAVENFEHLAKTDRVIINDNPINFFCFGNAVLRMDEMDNCKPVKRGDYLKIDGVITTLMALKMSHTKKS